MENQTVKKTKTFLTLLLGVGILLLSSGCERGGLRKPLKEALGMESRRDLYKIPISSFSGELTKGISWKDGDASPKEVWVFCEDSNLPVSRVWFKGAAIPDWERGRISFAFEEVVLRGGSGVPIKALAQGNHGECGVQAKRAGDYLLLLNSQKIEVLVIEIVAEEPQES